MILSQFDPEKRAIINPSDIVASLAQFPKTVEKLRKTCHDVTGIDDGSFFFNFQKQL